MKKNHIFCELVPSAETRGPKCFFTWYDNFGKNQTPLHRNGMAAISKKLNKYHLLISALSFLRFRRLRFGAQTYTIFLDLD